VEPETVAGREKRRQAVWYLACLVWGGALLVVGLRVFFWPGQRSVYPEYAAAGQHWRQGQDLYVGLGGYRYSPPATLLFALLSLAPASWGEVFWRLLSTAVFLGGLISWERACPGSAPVRRGGFLLAAAPLALSSLNNGQANLLLAGLLVLAVAAAARRRWNLATVCLVAACLLKAYPVALALLLLLLYPRPLAGRLLLGLLLGLLLPFAVHNADYVGRQYLSWLADLRSDDRSNWPLTGSYRDAWLLCRLWRLPLDRSAYLGVQLAAAALTAGLCLAARRTGMPETRLLARVLSLGSAWMMLFGPATESATYSLLAAPLAWMLLLAWEQPEPGWFRAGLSAAYGLLVLTFLRGWFPNASEFYAWGPHPLGALLFYLTLTLGILQPQPRICPGDRISVSEQIPVRGPFS
jgi:hypothetical protein